MINRLSHRLISVSLRRPWTVLATAVVTAILSVLASALWLRWNANPDELAARGSLYLQDYKAFIDEFGDIDCIHIVVAHKNNADRAEACVDQLATRLQGNPNIEGVFASIGPAEQLKIATRAMPSAELENLYNSAGAFPAILSGADPSIVLGQAKQLLADLPKHALLLSDQQKTQMGSTALFLLNTLAGVMEDSQARQTLAPLLRNESHRQYLKTDAGHLYFLRILPKKNYASLAVVAEPLADIRRVISEVSEVYPELEIGLTGKQVLLCDQMQIASRDMAFATGLAVLLVYLAFVVMLRGVVRPAIAVFCLALGTCWTYGVTTLTVGELSLISAAFTPILVGIGVEFGVHVLTRYQEERRQCAAAIAMRRALQAVGRGNLTGAGATCAAFFTAMLTQSPGFSQLGWIAGVGVLLCMVAMTVVMPAIVILYERWRESQLESAQIPVLEIPLPRRPFGPRFLVASGLVTLACIPVAFQVQFRDNVLELQPEGLASVEWEKRVLAESSSTLFAAFVVDDLAQVGPLSAKVSALPSVASVHSVLDAVADPTADRDKACLKLASAAVSTMGESPREFGPESLLNASRSLVSLEPFARIRSPRDADRMLQLARDLRRMSERFADPIEGRQARQELETFLSRVASSLHTVLEGNALPLRDALPDCLRSMLVSSNGKYLILAHPRKNIWDLASLEEFVGELRTLDPRVTGFPVVHLETVRDLKRSFYLSAILSLAAVTLLVWNDLRSIRDTALAMTPLIVGLVWTLGWMGMQGVDFNLVNFIAVPLLVGISVDSGVHIQHRYREQRTGDVRLGTTGSAVFLTSVTSMFGFGSLMVSAHRGAQSLGLIMTVGCGLILLSSLTILPALATLVRRPSSRLQEKTAANAA